MLNISVRSWATPLIMGAFVLMAGTGAMMFFELNQGLTTVVHQWFSWLFLIGAGGHIAANFKPLKNHLKSRRVKVSVAMFICVLFASLFSWGRITGPQLKGPIEQALVDAPLWSLAGATHTDEGALISKFKVSGIVATREQSIREVSVQNHVGENRLLAIVFLPE